MPGKKWIALFSSPHEHRIQFAKVLLMEEGIEAIAVNKKDSAYVLIGEIELFVRGEDFIRANYLLKKNKL